MEAVSSKSSDYIPLEFGFKPFNYAESDIKYSTIYNNEQSINVHVVR